MRLIVGLGNPGKEYENTRHNVGFLVVDRLADEQTWSFKKAFKGNVAEIMLGGEKTILLKPETFMNLSGESVRAVADFYKIGPEHIMIVHDDADLAFGRVLLKEGQTAAGHNGVQSIIDSFGGSLAFLRVRIGIGRPADASVPLESWVLGKWSGEEKINDVIDGVTEHIKKLFV